MICGLKYESGKTRRKGTWWGRADTYQSSNKLVTMSQAPATLSIQVLKEVLFRIPTTQI